MNKIGIITISDYDNYGNRLQNFAVQYFLESNFDVYVETIEKVYGSDKRGLFVINIKKFLNFLSMSKQWIFKRNKYVFQRKNSFLRFNKLIHKSKFRIYKGCNLKRIDHSYDFFIAGSDQIWNPNLFNDMYVNFLGFTDSKKKLAFAPSMAVEKLNYNQCNQFQKYLVNFPNLNTREIEGSNLLKRILDKECDTFIDPTLCVSKEDWEFIQKKPSFLKSKKYILLYFLGDISDERIKSIDEYATDKNLHIVNILDKKSKFYACGPAEFIYLVSNATVVFTDSFHATVFSIIFNKDFKVFSREGCGISMNSRISNLLNLVEAKNAYITDNNLKKVGKTIYCKDKIKYEIDHVKQYFKRSLGE